SSSSGQDGRNAWARRRPRKDDSEGRWVRRERRNGFMTLLMMRFETGNELSRDEESSPNRPSDPLIRPVGTFSPAGGRGWSAALLRGQRGAGSTRTRPRPNGGGGGGGGGSVRLASSDGRGTGNVVGDGRRLTVLVLGSQWDGAAGDLAEAE